MKQCPNCKTMIREKALICDNCGISLVVIVPIPPPEYCDRCDNKGYIGYDVFGFETKKESMMARKENCPNPIHGRHHP